MTIIKKFSKVIILFFLCPLLFANVAWAAEYTITQLTDDDYPGTGYIDIHNGQVVWNNSDGNDTEIFLYNGTQTIQITDNDYLDGAFTQIHNGQVVWVGYGYGGNNYGQIFLYDGTQIIQLTDHYYNSNYPDLHNGQVTWSGNKTVFFYNGAETIQLAMGDSLYIVFPRVHNGQVTWCGFDGNDREIFLYDGTQIVQLTDSSVFSYSWDPQIHNGQVTWNDYDGNDAEIFLYDGIQIIQLTDNNYQDSQQQVFNGQVTWVGYNGSSYEVFLYDGIQTVQLTDNSAFSYGWDPQIHNGQVVWNDYDGNDTEIFLYDGTQVIQITDNNYNDYHARIHNGQVAWKGFDGNDYETFLAKPKILEILDGVDFSAGTEVSNDPEILASGGASVEGAVTDGVTRLLLRLDATGSEAVTFTLEGTGNPDEDGILRSIDGSQEGNFITVDPATTTDGEKIFAIYQAPPNFVRADYEAEDKAVSERTIDLKIERPSDTSTETIRLVRPPLILVHGLWSDPMMWEDFLIKVSSFIPKDLETYALDYKGRNALYFEDNKDVLKDGMDYVRGKFLSEKNIAMVQADVLGHSMGGILSRIHAGAEMWPERTAYRRNDNYNMGDFHKMVTLDSPHFGSFLAKFALDLRDSLPALLFRPMFLAKMRSEGMPIDDGAVEDLTTSSPQIVYLNGVSTNPKSHAIVGDVESFDLALMPGYLGKFYTVFKDFDIYTTIPFPFPGESDLVVSAKSQIGRMNLSALSIFDHIHTAATTEDVAKQTINLLNADLNSLLFEDGFPTGWIPE